MPTTTAAKVTVKKVLVTYEDDVNEEHTLNVDPDEVKAIAWTDAKIVERKENPDHAEVDVPQRPLTETTTQVMATSFCWYDGKTWHC